MKTVYTTGCITKFEEWLKTNLYTVAGVFIGIALVQVSIVVSNKASDKIPGHFELFFPL